MFLQRQHLFLLPLPYIKSANMFLVISLCIIILIVGLGCSQKNILSPSIITGAVWLACLLMFLFMDHDLPKLKTQTFITISVWIFFFSISSLCTQACNYSKSLLDSPSLLIRNLYLAISILTYPLLLLFAYKAITLGTTGNWALDLRMAALGATETFDKPFESFYILFWNVSFFLELIAFKKKKYVRLVIISFIFLSYGFLTMSKIIIASSFIMAVVILHFKHIFKTKHLVYSISFLIFILILIQTLRHPSIHSEDSLIVYTFGNLSSFETVKPGTSVHFGENTFRIVYAVLHSLSLSPIEPINPLLPWIKDPLTTNTYTGLYPFYKDFGIWGVGIFAVILGGLGGWVYKKALSGNNFYISLYAHLMFIILLQFDAESFLTNFSRNVKFILLLAIPFFCTKHNLLYLKEKITHGKQ